MQAAHAAVEFTLRHEVAHNCTIVLLNVADEAALSELLFMAHLWTIPSEGFREPDLGDQLTAVATVASRLVSDLPLAFSHARGGERT